MTNLNILGNRERKSRILGDEFVDELNKRYEGEGKLEKEAQTSAKNLENKVNQPILQPSGELSFVTDENMYKEIVKYMDKEFPSQKLSLSGKLTFEDNVMKGSNSYIPVVVDMFLKSINSDYRIATQLDLENTLKFAKGFYVDSGLSLRNLTQANKKQAQYLFNQLKQKGIKETDFPLFISLRGLKLDDNLNFNLTEESFYKTAECLNWVNPTKFSKINDFGLSLKEDENSSRQIWPSNNALSGFCLLRGFGVDSSGGNFAYSVDDGRVVLAKIKNKENKQK